MRSYKIATISGAPNAGKSTVADAIVATRPNTILIELDQIRHVYRNPSKGPRSWDVIWDAIFLIDLWFDRGQDVLVLGPFWRKSYDYFRGHAEKKLAQWKPQFHHFTLAPPLEVALAQRGPRIPADDCTRLIRDFYARDIHRPDFGTVIDNAQQTPEETAVHIIRVMDSES